MEVILLYYKTIILVLAIINMVAAVLFLVWSDSLIYINKILKKWISVKSFDMALDKAQDIDDQIVRMRKSLGTVALLVTIALIFVYFRF